MSWGTRDETSGPVRVFGQDWQGRYDTELLLLPVDGIEPNPKNPRHAFDEEALDELAASIRRWGQLQPVVVRRTGGHYQLICGERRWRAHVRAGMPTIWAIERPAADDDLLTLALVENLHRNELSHAEKLAALDQLAEVVQATGLRKTAAYLHMDPGWLSRQLAVRRDPIIFPALEAGRLGFGHASELLRTPSSARARLLNQVVGSPRPVPTATIRAWVEEARAQEKQAGSAGTQAPSGSRPTRHSAYSDLRRQLERLGVPKDDQDLSALRDLVRTAHHLLAVADPAEDGRAMPDGDRRGKSTSVELTCLLCGEQAGVIEDGQTLHVRAPGSVRRAGARLACGRCGGTLTPGERTVRYRY